MPCGRTRRGQFATQIDYEQHRLAMMKLILGDDWEDKPLHELIAEHPELRRSTLHELIAEQEQRDDRPCPAVWQAEVGRLQPSADAGHAASEPRAIENHEEYLKAEDWLRSYLSERDGAERED
jgi:hypothetical protein